jgi:HEAT repeat protein
MQRRRLLGGLVLLGLALCAAPAQAQKNNPPGEFLRKDAAAWGKELDSPTAPMRRNAAFALGKLGRNAANEAPRLVKLVQSDPSPEVREAAAYALGEIGQFAQNREPTTVAVLATVLTDSKQAPMVRRSAAFALGEIGDSSPAVLEALGKALRDDSPAVRQNVAYALGRLGGDAVPYLRQALQDGDVLVRRDAASSLSGLGDKARPAVADLVGALNKPGTDSEVKKIILAGVVKLVKPDDKDAISDLVKVLSDGDPEVQRNAAFALSNIGGEGAAAAIPVLRKALFDHDPAIRSQAAAAFKNIGPAAVLAVPDLIKALGDPNKEVCTYAALALGGIEKEAAPAVPALVRVLADTKENEKVRVTAAWALSRIKDVPAAVAAIPTLLEVIGDPRNPATVRERTLWALRVHVQKFREIDAIRVTLTNLLSEPKSKEVRMMRYDAAYMLGMVWGSSAPPKTLDVLNEFLHDDTIQIYVGTTAKVEGGGKEGAKSGSASAKETGMGDGRTLAVDALKNMGGEVVRARPELMKQLENLSNTATFLPLRDKAKQALSEFGK